MCVNTCRVWILFWRCKVIFFLGGGGGFVFLCREISLWQANIFSCFQYIEQQIVINIRARIFWLVLVHKLYVMRLKWKHKRNDVLLLAIAHFLIDLCVETSLSCNTILMKISFHIEVYFHANQTHFHKNSFWDRGKTQLGSRHSLVTWPCSH